MSNHESVPHCPGLTGATVVRTKLFEETLVKAMETFQRQGTLLVSGDPGLGKTFVCRAVMYELALLCGAEYIWLQLGDKPSTKEVLTQLLHVIGIHPDRREAAWELAATLGDALAAEPRFVWVDEAQYLKASAFTTLRTIHDRPDAKWGLALVGSPRMATVLEREQPELLSRVGRQVRFGPIEDRTQLLTTLNSWHPLLAACDDDRLDRINRIGPKGNFRAWANVLETLIRIVGPTGRITDKEEAVALHQCGYRLPAELLRNLT